jgi:hypothetical protein
MYPSLTLCRSQEAHHRERAAGALLENVRTIATVAANAWGQEALLAQAREKRRDRTVQLREASGRYDVAPEGAASAWQPGAER